MDAALKIISRDGYHSARLEDIADEAGFSKASLYHYFPDREALVLQLVLREQRDLMERCEEILLEEKEDFCEGLKRLIRLFFSTMMKHAQFHKSFGDLLERKFSNMADMASKHTELFQEVIRNHQEISACIFQLVDRGLGQGKIDLPENLDSQRVALYINSIIEGIFKQSCLRDMNNIDIDGETERLFLFLSPWLKQKTEM
ncbi:hypothetical protein CHISP_1088 [Chitinispirillum alkaliphilum]|nr:hypothetical protein CHISP_1088 [Chitinispirillum alkaliphilum]